MPDLVLRSPFPERDNQHPELFFFGPEAVFHPRIQDALIVSLGPRYPPVHFQIGTLIKKMKQFCPNLVRMKAGAFPRFHMCEVD